ncbi:FAD-dependent oxidoreductase, partial [Escherichia sp. TWPC-MK]
MHLKSGKKLKADCLLYANGRTGNTDSLALQNIGLETDSRGQLKVNSMYQTAQPHVYAVGIEQAVSFQFFTRLQMHD